jgi:hypothetical protein
MENKMSLNLQIKGPDLARLAPQEAGVQNWGGSNEARAEAADLRGQRGLVADAHQIGDCLLTLRSHGGQKAGQMPREQVNKVHADFGRQSPLSAINLGRAIGNGGDSIVACNRLVHTRVIPKWNPRRRRSWRARSARGTAWARRARRRDTCLPRRRDSYICAV